MKQELHIKHKTHVIIILICSLLGSLRIIHYWVYYLYVGKTVSDTFVKVDLYALKVISIIDFIPVTIMDHFGIFYPATVSNPNITADIIVSLNYFIISFPFWLILAYSVIYITRILAFMKK